MYSILLERGAVRAATKRLVRGISAVAVAVVTASTLPSAAVAQTALAGGPAINLSSYFGEAPESSVGYTTGPHVSPNPVKGTFDGNARTYAAFASSTGSETLYFKYRCETGTPSPYFCAEGSVTVTIITPPATAQNYSGSTAYGASKTFAPTVAYATSVEVLAAPGHGTASASGTSLTYAPANGWYGSDSFTFRACGSGGCSAAATATIITSPEPLVVDNYSGTTPFNTPLNFAPRVVSGEVTSIVSQFGPSHGTLTINGTNMTYTPGPGYVGGDGITLLYSGPAGNRGINVTIITQAPVNPIITGGAISASFNTPTVHDFALQNGGSLSLVAAPSHGTVTFSGGLATYTPTLNYIGTDTFSAKATNNSGDSNTAVVNVTVQPPPIPVIAGGSLRLAFNASGSHDFSPTDGGSLAISTPPSHGTATINGGRVTYAPNEDYIGADTFAVTATNLGGTSAPATVAVTVDPPPIPVITGGALRLAFNEAGSHDFAPTDRGTLAISMAPAHGTATINGGRVTYAPNEDYIGSDTFAVTATNLGGTSAPATVAVTVDPPPIPVISSASVSTAFNQAATYTFTPSDRGQVAIATQPTHGTAALAGNAVTYTPATDYIGTDSLTVTATNLGGTSAPVTLTITVVPPDAPTAGNATIGTQYETAGTTELVVSGDFRSVAIVTAPGHGTATLAGLVATYTPQAGYYGPDTFTYEATGPGGSSGQATVNVTVARPGAPVASAKSLELKHGQSGDVALEATGIFSGFRIVAAPAGGTVVLTGSTAAYTPKAGFGGKDAFEYVAEGPGGDSAPAKVTVTVEGPPPAPAAPVVMPQAVVPVSKNGEPITLTLKASASSATFQVSRQAKLGRASIQGETATYTPNEGAKGEDSFAVVAKDGTGAQSAPVEFKVALQGAPEEPGDKPVAADLSAEAQQGAEVRISATAGATGGPFEEVVIVQQPTSGELRAEGVELVFKAPAEFTGDLVAKFALKANGHTSEAATLTITVRPIRELAPKEATAAGDQPAIVSLTSGAEGGPFVSGAVMAMTPATAGRAEVLSGEAAQAALNALAAKSGRPAAPAAAGEGDFYLRFEADPQFSGMAVIQYVLTNEGGAKVQGVLNVQVHNLPDPTRDPSVGAIVAAQTQAANRFGSAQVSNVNRRLEALHDQQAGKGALSVSASGGDMLRVEGEPGFDPIRERDRASRIPQRLADDTSAETSPDAPVGTGKVWASGAIQFGRAKGREGGQRFDFTTSGLSVGADTQLGGKVVVGAGGGFGREVSDLANDLGQVEARSVSLFAYGSVRPSEKLFIDGVVGGSKMDFQNTRTVQATGGEVRGDRSGDQLFGSLSASWNYATPVVRLSPYARLQYVRSTLAAYTEKGDATYGLTFSKQKADEMNVSAGLRAEYVHRMARGVLLPRARAELTQILSQTGTSRVSYTSLVDGPSFAIDGTPTGMTSVLGGLGLTWRGDNGWDLSIDVEHSASGADNGVTSVRVGGSGKF